jgi:hypothetical protein
MTITTTAGSSTTMPDPDDGIDPSPDHDEDRYEVLLHPDDEMASPQWYPRLMNMSAAFMFRAVIARTPRPAPSTSPSR